ncbi:cell division protein ZapE [Vibrio sp.]|nr:cell division protein ZapE [Vibrio sp.]
MTPKQRYESDLKQSHFYKDAAQAQAVDALDGLYQEYVTFWNTPKKKEKSGWKKWFSRPEDIPEMPKGLYFWGGVGRGKTYLMDCFFDALPSSRKYRVHFHRFMHRVHSELKTLAQVEDPLKVVSKRFKQEFDVLCFDEFFVSDITDAMILAGLLEALYAEGITLVATSNIPPENLYRNGLQRARFLPAIALIEKNCTVMNIDSGVDYRLRTLEKAEIYHYPLDQDATNNIDNYFSALVGTESVLTRIEVNNRELDIVKAANGVMHATFEQLCQTARSQNDYIELSQLYHTVLLSDVRQMSVTMDDAARRFIALVDEFYERHVKLIISAEVALEQLYSGGRLEFEFQRCQSRLIEMQSQEYLSREHLA